MTDRTLISAAQVIAYQPTVGHTLLEPGAVIVEDGRIAWVGPPERAPACGTTVDARKSLVTPGFVNTHMHVTTPVTRSFREDLGNPLFYMSGLYESLPISWVMPPEDAAICAEASLVEVLRGGSTTAVVMGTSIPERVAETAARLGMRVYVTPGYKSGSWRVSSGGSNVVYQMDEPAGERGLERNAEFVRSFDGAHGGLVHAFLGPLQVDTCSPDLLRRTRAMADRLGARVQIHASQSLLEFQEIRRRHGRTPIELLHDVGLCGPDVSVAHAIFVAGHSWTAGPAGEDLELLARSGTFVAHCPMVFARSGAMLESLPHYLAGGVRVALGTDTTPQDILQEMRLAALLGKVGERDARRASAAEVFGAATTTGADLLGRRDLGRIEPGAQADLLFFDLDRVSLTPHRDPIRTLVFTATSADIARVMVAGKTVVERGAVLACDESALAEALGEATTRLWARLPEVDWAGRGLDAISPPSLPRWQADASGPAEANFGRAERLEASSAS